MRKNEKRKQCLTTADVILHAVRIRQRAGYGHNARGMVFGCAHPHFLREWICKIKQRWICKTFRYPIHYSARANAFPRPFTTHRQPRWQFNKVWLMAVLSIVIRTIYSQLCNTEFVLKTIVHSALLHLNSNGMSVSKRWNPMNMKHSRVHAKKAFSVILLQFGWKSLNLNVFCGYLRVCGIELRSKSWYVNWCGSYNSAALIRCLEYSTPFMWWFRNSDR